MRANRGGPCRASSARRGEMKTCQESPSEIDSAVLDAAQKFPCAATRMQDVVVLCRGGWKSVNVGMGKVASSQVSKRFA